MMKLPAAVTLGLLVLAGFVVFSFLSFWLAVRPPRLRIPITPADLRLPAEDVRVVTDDGLRLAAWLIPGAPGRAVVLLHGYPAEKADMLRLAATLHPRFTTLLLDLRYFGQSEGRATTLGVRERGDLSRAIDFLRDRGFPRVGVFGFSLGGAIALATAAEDPRIRAVVAYGTFAELRALGYELYAWLWLLKYPLVELMALWGRLFLGTDLLALSPARAAAGLGIPVLLVHSRTDEQIGFHHAERLRRALEKNPRASLYVLEGAYHGELPADFEARLRAFFEEHLGR